MEIGDIKITMLDYEVKEGELKSHGQKVSKKHYSELFALIGTKWGGEGGEFNLPNIVGDGFDRVIKAKETK